MVTGIIVAVVITLVLALVLKFIEGHGGTLGDSSLAPAVLVMGMIVVLILLAVGWMDGSLIVKLK